MHRYERLSNHCQFRKDPPVSGVWPKDAVAPKGWHFANWKTQEWQGENRVELPASKQGWSDCYRQSGLDYLREMGYAVIQAI